MSYEERFGKKLLASGANKGRALPMKILLIIPSLVFIATGAVLALNPDIDFLTEEEARLIPLLIALFFVVGVAGILFIVLSIVRSRRSSAVLFERGVIHTQGSEVTEVGFSDTEGIRLETSAIAVGGVAIPLGSFGQESVIIRKKDGTEIVFRKSDIPDFRVFADKFGAVYTRWLLDGLTMDNMADAKISFGPDLKLYGGQFIYTKKDQEIVMPLSDVHSLEIETGDAYNYFWLLSKTETDKKGNPKKAIGGQTAKALNLEALYIIVQRIIGNQ